MLIPIRGASSSSPTNHNEGSERMADLSKKVIITCAVTGGIHTPTMSDALPITPDRDRRAGDRGGGGRRGDPASACARSGDGRPTPDPNVFMQFLPRIKQATDAVINITTGGGLNMTVEERLQAPLLAKPEMCSLNMGSMNFAIFPLADRYSDVEARLGRALSARHRRLHLPQHVPRHRNAS